MRTETTYLLPVLFLLRFASSVEYSSGNESLVLGDEEISDACTFDKIPRNPYIHKSTYYIGAHAIVSLEQTLQEITKFSEYLSMTAGQKFDPPIKIEVIPHYFEGFFSALENEELDFIYANPSVYSCIGTQVGASALATVVKTLKVRDHTFELDVYGGVIATRSDNDEINNIEDLKDKIIGAGSIVDLMGGQMQFYEMLKAGMSFVNDPTQIVFTQDQVHIVRGILSGRFDAGFVRTAQIEQTTDENGAYIDPGLFKIIQPKIYVLDSGELFPFLHSTEILPEWAVASFPHVPSDVQKALEDGLLAFHEYAVVGNLLNECLEKNSTQYCMSLTPKQLYSNAPCDTTHELALLAAEASNASHISGFRPARSYFKLRTIQQEAGFLTRDDDHNWECIRPTNLFDGITCPTGYFRRWEREFLQGCQEVGLACDDNDEFDCFCKPCVKAFEVDVYKHNDGERDDHLQNFFGESLPGCKKMSICGTVQQGDSLTLRIYDNMQRDAANVTVINHAGDQARPLQVRSLDAPYLYEITVYDKIVQVQVLDIWVNGEPISQSPIRVVVEEKNCDAVYGTGSNRVPDAEGECVCAGNTYEMGNTCLDSTYFFLIIFAAVFIVLAVITSVYLGYKKQQSDSVWHVSVDELHFNEPPEVIGQGGFGVVILGQYRGTKVAVKRVLPPLSVRKAHSNRLPSEEPSIDVANTSSSNPSGTIKANDKKKLDNKQKGKNVKFGEQSNTGDIESQSKTNSKSGSNNDWERLMMMHNSDNDILKILESATASDHGSGDMFNTSMSMSRSNLLLRILPMCLRFDEHSRRVNEFVIEMRMLSRLRHPCITTVMGAVISPTVDPMLVMEFMEYGSLYDLLHNETMTLGGEIIIQIVRDVVQGIQFLHASKPPILHGDLKAKNILVDSRFRAKVADFGFSHFKNAQQRNILQGTPFYMAPEYLRRHSEYTTACDIYSCAMIIYEIYARSSPFEGEDPRKVLPKVCHPRLNKRPPIPESCPPKMVDLMKKCWSANPFFRPSAKDIDYVLVEMSAKDTEPLETARESIRDNLKRKPTSLYDVFPKHIADALNAGKKVEAESHEIVTIVFSDIVGFTTISEQSTPMKVSHMLDRLYQAFDMLADKHHIFKVETIGDAYMGVTNLDGSEYDTHVKQVAEYAQDAIRAASQILIDEEDPSLGYVQIRVGFNSGPVVSNVIGSLNPRYGLFGDTVNTASRMESSSMPGKIHCSYASAQLLMNQAPEIPLTMRGMIKIKGKGKMRTYWVGDENELNRSLQNLIVETKPVSEAENDQLSQRIDCDEDGALMRKDGRPTQGKDEDSSSHETHITHCMSVGDSPEDQDHFIHVHCVDDGEGTQKAQIQMDGTVNKIDLQVCTIPNIQHLYTS